MPWLFIEDAGREHACLIKLVRRFLDDHEKFGLVGFEIQARLDELHGQGEITYTILNEHKATLITTYLRDTDEVIRNVAKPYCAMSVRCYECPVDIS